MFKERLLVKCLQAKTKELWCCAAGACESSWGMEGAWGVLAGVDCCSTDACMAWHPLMDKMMGFHEPDQGQMGDW